GSPRYSEGNTAAAVCASGSGSPCQRHIVNAPSATKVVASTRSSLEAIVSDVSTAAVPAATRGTCRPVAAASCAYSTNASTRNSSATARKRRGGANQTTPTARQ